MQQSPPRRTYRILLGVSGGIAAYKACGLTSRLVQRGDQVDVMLTEDAQRFVPALTFAALTRRPVHTSLWERAEEIPHIALVRAADIYLIAPATAQTIAKLAHGFADDLIAAAALAADIPLVVAPAMNSSMYLNPATQANLALLRERGVTIVPPESGFLAERESGIGRLANEEQIIAALDHRLATCVGDAAGAAASSAGPLSGRTVLITAGPTREAIDPVRFISNAATGAMGIALAREAAARGAHVFLVLGPTHLAAPSGVTTRHVVSAAHMQQAALELVAEKPDLVIATAAVADERPAVTAPQKRKRHHAPLTELLCEPTPDIVANLRQALPAAYVVGFAAETERHEEHAREKLARKQLNAIVVNDVSAGKAFGEVENSLTILFSDGRRDLGAADKATLAARLLDTLTELVS